MQLKDIANMTYYLENNCYCPGEIYDDTGFFYRIFEAEDACTLLIKGAYKGDDVTAVICKNQILCFWIDNNTITDAVRYDATENNVSEITQLLAGKKNKITTDEFEPGKTKIDLKNILSIADAILID